MSVRYDEARVELDWLADFVGWRTTKFTVKFVDQDDPLLLALYARYQKQLAEKAAAVTIDPKADPFVIF